MTHRLLRVQGSDPSCQSEGGSMSDLTLTDSSLPGFRGLKLQKMTIVFGLMVAELWKVHFRRTSVPLTASTSPGVYTRIPLASSTPATKTWYCSEPQTAYAPWLSEPLFPSRGSQQLLAAHTHLRRIGNLIKDAF